MKPEKIYRVISIETRLPDTPPDPIQREHHVLVKDVEKNAAYYNKQENKWYWHDDSDYENEAENNCITHWLEEQQDKYVLSKEQIEDYKNKMECLIGYCELSKKMPKMPVELEMVIDEAKKFIQQIIQQNDK